MKTAVEAIFVGKARQYNRRFLQMCSHHLIEPSRVRRRPAGRRVRSRTRLAICATRCSAQAASEEPGRAERLLEDQCIAYAQRINTRVQGPDDLGRIPGRTGEPDGAARPFDGFVEKAVRATTTCLISADQIATASTHAPPAGWSWSVPRERIVVLFNDEIVPTTRVSSGATRSSTIPALSAVLVRKPGALRNGAHSRIGTCRPP